MLVNEVCQDLINVRNSLVSKPLFGMREFTELMTNHILRYRHRNIVFTIVHHETDTAKILE
jgi:hypothetical protein